MSKIVGFARKQSPDLPWVSCSCGSSRWFLLLSPVVPDIGIPSMVAIRCAGCGNQIGWDSPVEMPSEPNYRDNK